MLNVHMLKLRFCVPYNSTRQKNFVCLYYTEGRKQVFAVASKKKKKYTVSKKTVAKVPLLFAHYHIPYKYPLLGNSTGKKKPTFLHRIVWLCSRVYLQFTKISSSYSLYVFEYLRFFYRYMYLFLYLRFFTFTYTYRYELQTDSWYLEYPVVYRRTLHVAYGSISARLQLPVTVHYEKTMRLYARYYEQIPFFPDMYATHLYGSLRLFFPQRLLEIVLLYNYFLIVRSLSFFPEEYANARESLHIPRIAKRKYALSTLKRVRQDNRFISYARAASPFLLERGRLLPWYRSRYQRY